MSIRTYGLEGNFKRSTPQFTTFAAPANGCLATPANGYAATQQAGVFQPTTTRAPAVLLLELPRGCSFKPPKNRKSCESPVLSPLAKPTFQASNSAQWPSSPSIAHVHVRSTNHQSEAYVSGSPATPRIPSCRCRTLGPFQGGSSPSGRDGVPSRDCKTQAGDPNNRKTIGCKPCRNAALDRPIWERCSLPPDAIVGAADENAVGHAGPIEGTLGCKPRRSPRPLLRERLGVFPQVKKAVFARVTSQIQVCFVNNQHCSLLSDGAMPPTMCLGGL